MLLSRLAYYLSSLPTLLTGVRSLTRGRDGQWLLTLRDGKCFFVRNAMDVWLIKEDVLDREYERASIEIQPGWKVLDIGAGIGDFAVSIASRAGVVYCFEPDPTTYRLLWDNLTLNDAGNVYRFPARVAGKDWDGGSRNGYALDSVIDAFGPIDYLKLDTEGDELWILQSASLGTLAQIKHICLEYHDWHYRHGDLWRVLDAAGFEVTETPSRAHEGLGLMYARRGEDVELDTFALLRAHVARVALVGSAVFLFDAARLGVHQVRQAHRQGLARPAAELRAGRMKGWG